MTIIIYKYRLFSVDKINMIWKLYIKENIVELSLWTLAAIFVSYPFWTMMLKGIGVEGYNWSGMIITFANYLIFGTIIILFPVVFRLFRGKFPFEYIKYKKLLSGSNLKPDSPDMKEANDISKILNQKVFLVHGHDDGTKETVARFLSKIGLEPVILHEQPNKGRTIIEKFQDYSDVSYAIVLLTPDDIGAAFKKKETLSPRARQNVVFEFVN
jgi:hypothetical protein